MAPIIAKDKGIVAQTAGHDIVAAVAGDDVIARVASEGIIAAAAHEIFEGDQTPGR